VLRILSDLETFQRDLLEKILLRCEDLQNASQDRAQVILNSSERNTRKAKNPGDSYKWLTGATQTEINLTAHAKK
jgi:hypothetical protein